MTKPRVVFWNSQPTPYMVGRWNAVARRGNLDFRAWFNVRRESDRSWDVDESEWHFPGRYLTPRVIGGRSLYLPLDELRLDQPDLVVQAYNSTSFAAGICLGRAAGGRVAFRTLPTYDAWVQRRCQKELMKHVVFRAVDGIKTGGVDGHTMFAKYGIPEDRIFSVIQSIDVEHYRKAQQMSFDERTKRRELLGVSGCVFLYVGRLWTKKGLDYLFEAYGHVRRTDPNVSLLIVGDGIDELRYRYQAETLPGVAFAGFVQPVDLPAIYGLADVFVFPTLGDPHGLVVEEAMAAGLPVICTEAAGDIRARLLDGDAGIVVPPADAAALGTAMVRLSQDSRLRLSLAAVGAALVANRTHEDYARDFERFVGSVISMPARRTPAAGAASIVGRILSRTLSGPGARSESGRRVA